MTNKTPSSKSVSAKSKSELRMRACRTRTTTAAPKAVPEPQIDLAYSHEIEARWPAVAGGLSLALARTFTIIDPQSKHPATEQWERAFRIFDLLLYTVRNLGFADR